MVFYSISRPEVRVSLRQAVLRSVVDQSDLFMPVTIPLLKDDFIRNLKWMRLADTARVITETMLGEDLPAEVIDSIVRNAFNFEIPLKRIDKDLYVLELFHGPTLAFKDVGARFMAYLFEYLVKNETREITVLAATSGDTGSAVANAFYNRTGIRVVILYPSGKVSHVQENQLTTMGGNITALEIDGTFDDCQLLVRKAFSDQELNDMMILTSANSINFARLFPQSFYYFHACSQFSEVIKPLVFSVPSGNFGNLTAGLMARKMGLPVSRFIASTNINNSVPEYLTSGLYKPQPTKHTITNAMDVGNPGNFPRILEMHGKDCESVKSILSGYWFTDIQTVEGMRELMNDYGYICDPHSSVAYMGLKEYRRQNDCTGIFLATAHPVKFPEVVSDALGREPDISGSISLIMTKEKKSVRMENSYKDFRDFIIQHRQYSR